MNLIITIVFDKFFKIVVFGAPDHNILCAARRQRGILTAFSLDLLVTSQKMHKKSGADEFRLRHYLHIILNLLLLINPALLKRRKDNAVFGHRLRLALCASSSRAAKQHSVVLRNPPSSRRALFHIIYITVFCSSLLFRRFRQRRPRSWV